MCTIYIVVIPHLALRNYVALLDLTCRCESAKHTPRGEGRYGLIYCSRRNFRQLENPQHPLHFIRRAVSTRITPPTDPARRNIGTPTLSLGSLSRLSVCLSHRFFLLTSLSESFRVRTRTRRRTVGDTWIFISVSPCPVARKYFLGSPLIYHNRDACPPDQNL